MSRNQRPKKARGQSLVEFAISLTLILLLLAGAVDFGMAFFTFIAMRDAAQEGALYGSMAPADTNGIIQRVRSSATMPLDLTDPAVRVNVRIVGNACEGGGVEVTLQYDYPITMPLIGAVIGRNTIPLTATVTDTILLPPCP